MKNLTQYIVEKFKISKDIKNISIVDTNKEKSGKIEGLQKELVENIISVLTKESRKGINLFKGTSIRVFDLDDFYGQTVRGGKDLEEWLDEAIRGMSTIKNIIEDDPEELQYAFPSFKDCNKEELDLIENLLYNSATLICALYSNDLKDGDWTEGVYVTYDSKTGEYNDIDIVLDYF